MSARNFDTAESSPPSRVCCVPRSSAWVSKPPRLTVYALVGTPALMHRATTSSWADRSCLPLLCSPAEIGPNVADTVRSARNDAQTMASVGVSVAAAPPSPCRAAPRSLARGFCAPTGNAAAVHRLPTDRGGSTEPVFTARTGSSPVASSQRPIHPVLVGALGEAVCQMSIERKWL